MGAIINTGRDRIAQAQGIGEILTIDRFVFALIPGLDPTATVNLDEPMPASEHVVHTAPVAASGYLANDKVVYSVLLDSTVGNFDFNWVGLLHADDTLMAVSYTPAQTKYKTAGLTTGNTLTRSFLVQFDSATDVSGINVPASAWQIDFMGRLQSQDEHHRSDQAAFYGTSVFINDGFKVVSDGVTVSITAGYGFVGGLRVTLAQNASMSVGTLPKDIYLDAAMVGDSSSSTVELILKTSPPTTPLADFTDSVGDKHFVVKLASVASNYGVTDHRRRLAVAGSILDALLDGTNYTGEITASKVTYNSTTVQVALGDLLSSNAHSVYRSTVGLSQILTLNLSDYQYAWFPHGNLEGDNGGGYFYKDLSDESSSPNGVTIAVDSGGKRWKRIFDKPAADKSHLSSGLVFSNLGNLKQGIANDGGVIDFASLIPNGTQISITLQEYAAGSGVGGAPLIGATLSTAREIKGDPAWVPDQRGEHYIGSGSTHVAFFDNSVAVVTPEMWGARGDGITEDHVAIQAALDWIERRGSGSTLAPTRTYLCGDTIRARSFASIVGPGKFVAKAGLNKQVIDIYAAYPVRRLADVVYADFMVDGNGAHQAATTDDILGACITVRASTENPTNNGDPQKRGEFENVELKNITCVNGKMNGFYVGKTTFVQRGYMWSGLKASGCVNGLFLDNYCEYVAFLGITMQKNTYGVRDNGASNLSFIGGTACNNSEAGFYIEKTGRNTSKKIIQGLHINHNGRGVWIGNGVGTVGVVVDHISIQGNHILANSAQGVVGSGGFDVEVIDNFFSGNGSIANTADDIYISDTCKRWRINNKHINSTGRTRHAVYWISPRPEGADSHAYHRIDGTFEGYAKPINYMPYGNASSTPLNASYCTVQGLFEYWNGQNTPPSATALNSNGSVHLHQIPFGTICLNNADQTGNERWVKELNPSSSGAVLTAAFRRLDSPQSGPTASRPSSRYIGMVYFDTTLGKPVWWSGTVWKDAAGAIV